MSLYCTCPRCANTDPVAICENALLEAQMSVARAQRSSHRWLLGLLAILSVLALSVALLPSS